MDYVSAHVFEFMLQDNIPHWQQLVQKVANFLT